jgi:hypothetical protein
LYVDSAETEKRENGDDDDDQPNDVDDIVHLPVLLDARFSKLHARLQSAGVARLLVLIERIAAVWAFTRATAVAVLPHLERHSMPSRGDIARVSPAHRAAGSLGRFSLLHLSIEPNSSRVP